MPRRFGSGAVSLDEEDEPVSVGVEKEELPASGPVLAVRWLRQVAATTCETHSSAADSAAVLICR